jgi:hypothetical protein
MIGASGPPPPQGFFASGETGPVAAGAAPWRFGIEMSGPFG